MGVGGENGLGNKWEGIRFWMEKVMFEMVLICEGLSMSFKLKLKCVNERIMHSTKSKTAEH